MRQGRVFAVSSWPSGGYVSGSLKKKHVISRASTAPVVTSHQEPTLKPISSPGSTTMLSTVLLRNQSFPLLLQHSSILFSRARGAHAARLPGSKDRSRHGFQSS